jgi:hypothetical protein
LAAIATVGCAYDATLVTKDMYGNTLTKSVVSFNAGEAFTVSANIHVDTNALDQIELTTGTYSVNKCTVSMTRQLFLGMKYQTIPIGDFDHICDWPAVYSDAKSTYSTAKINVRDIAQFHETKTKAKVVFTCQTDDVTLANDPAFTCANKKSDSVISNTPAYQTFTFENYFTSKDKKLLDMVNVYVSNFGYIFLGGANAFLDFGLIALNDFGYKQVYITLMDIFGQQAHPKMPKMMLQDPMIEKHFSPEKTLLL